MVSKVETELSGLILQKAAINRIIVKLWKSKPHWQ